MPAPVTAIAALGRTRIGHKIAIGALTLVLLISAFAATPVIAIPLAIAGSSVASGPDTTRPVPAANGDWGFPMAGPYSFGRGFGHNPVTGCGFCSVQHKGYDMSQGCGSPIFAAGPGTVLSAGALSGWGNTVRIDHGDGLITLYGHMQWGSLRVSEGQAVTAGTPLGAEGNTGRSFGCHLHFEVIHDGVSIDPVPFMAARGILLT
ncbi:M23 family metallopeptidase [Microbacterium sp. ET2]|uniref:M23 family metallopeptidase n=1 Tax=Microbacterium albipurpureum TaxID=3050384 RepID=UPI00259CCEAC|nr:M23 family metallopeptidase [Microbacterium sp. ET2 (Ac-2212)]WJL97030.1 M23 family metallopeptidase [Microbacterium sp. ET2 (Ac-2212)]